MCAILDKDCYIKCVLSYKVYNMSVNIFFINMLISFLRNWYVKRYYDKDMKDSEAPSELFIRYWSITVDSKDNPDLAGPGKWTL